MRHPTIYPNVVLASLLLAGCGQANPVGAELMVHEFFADIVIETSEAGDFVLDDDGNVDAECRLGRKVATESGLQHPILEASTSKTAAYRSAIGGTRVCDFNLGLQHAFCAMSSVQEDLDCKVSRGSGPGWFVEARFAKPESAYMQCSIACFDFKPK